ncbi:MAG: hypothetical protein OCD01_13685 [Fibrobacterales bacterium]
MKLFNAILIISLVSIPLFSNEKYKNPEESSSYTQASDPSVDNEPFTRDISVTISPLHLLFPVYEFTAEFKATPKVGVGAMLGFGSMELENNYNETKKIPVFELAGQLNYYLFGNFDHGMQVGAELLYLHVSIPEDEGVSGTGSGIGIGPYVGYKVISNAGFTFNIQLGYQQLFAQAVAKDRYGNEIEGSTDTGIPLLNINLGWSF